MCGLAGVVGNLYKAETDAFRDLMIMASMRGGHSSGVGSVSGISGNRQFGAVKTLGGPSNLFETKGWDREVTASRVALIGHCRHATLGEVTHENAHPFDYETVLGTHNGTLQGDWRKQLGSDTSDSRALFRNLDHSNVADVMAKVEGAWALAWYDRELETFNLLRNSQRPLYVAMLRNGESLAYASESYALHYALIRDGRFKTEDIKVEMVPVDTLWQWKVGVGGKLGDKARSKIEGRPFQSVGRKHWGGNYSWTDDDGETYSYYGTSGGTNASPPPPPPPAPKPPAVVVPATAPAKTDTGETEAPKTSVVPFQQRTPPGPRRLAADERRALNGDIVNSTVYNYVDTCCCCGAQTEFYDTTNVILTEYESLCKNCKSESETNALTRLKRILKPKTPKKES